MSRSGPENLSETPSTRRPVRCIGGLLRANLKAHLDGEMSALRSGLVRWHLAQCTECREELRWLRRLGEDMKELESARPRPELRARILANLPTAPPAPGIRVVHSRPDQVRSTRLAPRLALAGGMVMLLAFSAVFALKSASHLVPAPRNAAESARSGSPQTDASPQSSASPEPSASAMDMVTYQPPIDPNNALADKLFRESMDALEREKLAQGQDDWHRLMAQARAVARKTDRTATEMGIALAVPNLSAVRLHLPIWAKQEGARLVVNGRVDPSQIDGSDLPTAQTGNITGNVVAFYVPAARGPAFLTALKHLGQISLLPADSGSPSTAAAVQPELSVDGAHKVIPTAPTAESGATTERTVAARDKHLKAARYLVLTVLLQSAVRN